MSETVWDGEKMVEGLTEKEAQKMVDEDKGQWLRHHDGSAFKHRHEFAGYANKTMETKTKADDKAAPKKSAPKKTKKVEK